MYETKAIFVCMIMRNISKLASGNRYIKKLHDLYYDVVYKYTSIKLDRLLKAPAFRLVFKYFNKSGDLDKMLEMDETMQDKKQIYKERAEELIADFST